MTYFKVPVILMTDVDVVVEAPSRQALESLSEDDFFEGFKKDIDKKLLPYRVLSDNQLFTRRAAVLDQAKPCDEFGRERLWTYSVVLSTPHHPDVMRCLVKSPSLIKEIGALDNVISVIEEQHGITLGDGVYVEGITPLDPDYPRG